MEINKLILFKQVNNSLKIFLKLFPLFIFFVVVYDINISQALNQENVNHFSNVLNKIKESYVVDVSEEKILEYAINGMLANLDPHSQYLNKSEYQEIIEDGRGEFAGIGVEITKEQDIVKVIAPIAESPADKAGIRAQDAILEIDGIVTENMSLGEVMELMSQPQKKFVTLLIARKDHDQPMLFTIKKDLIKTDSVTAKLLNNHYAYIKIIEFQADTAKELRNMIKTLQQQAHENFYGLILDLRDNPGGLVDAAVEVVNLFLESSQLTKFSKRILYTRGRLTGANTERLANATDILSAAPMILLINSGSASASEIVAGALQDYQRALVIGEKSFGKGSIQTLIPIDDDHAIKLTTALYHTPSGRVIQGGGIEPDILVEDLQLKNNTQAVIIQPVREASFYNYLPNSETSISKKQADDEVTHHSTLLWSDYQLHQALYLLQALHITHQKMIKDFAASNKSLA